ncbi:MAG: ABC transporter permease, partial [Nocardioides sp.]
LVLAGRVATRAPLSVRLAARDAARHRTRAVPTVAAIMAGAALLTTIGIAVSSDDAQERRDYEPSLAAGEGTISWDAALDPDGDDIITTLGVVAPSLRHFLVGEVGQDWSAPVDEGTGEPVVMALPAGCSLEESMTGLDSGAGGCALAGTHASVPIGRGDVVLGAPIQVLPAAELARLYDLSSADRAAVARGALLSASPLLGNTTSVELVIGSLPIDAEGLQHDVSVSRRVSVPAVSLDPETADNNGRAASTFLSTEAVERLALPLRITGMQIYDPTGPITSAVKRSIQEQLDDYSYLYVELGYTSPMKWLIRGLFGAAGLLILVVTLIATALAVSEQQADLGTLAAVGASRGTRRRMAATQAWLISFIGVALGIILGFMPGIGYTFPLTVPDYINTGNGGRIITDDRVGDPVIVVPWLGLLLVLVVVPLVAAAIAAVAIRRAPGLTRRGD